MAEEQFLHLDTEMDTSLEDLDFAVIRQERFDRNRHFLESVNAGAAARVFPGHEHKGRQLSVREQAAVTIQRVWRGYKGRELYVSALWEKFEKEEERLQEKVRYQMEEGELLVENRQLEVLLDDGKTTRRNAVRRYISKVITIQRAWRSYLEKKTKQKSTNNTGIFGDAIVYHGDTLIETNRHTQKRLNPFNVDDTSDIETDSKQIEGIYADELVTVEGIDSYELGAFSKQTEGIYADELGTVEGIDSNELGAVGKYSKGIDVGKETGDDEICMFNPLLETETTQSVETLPLINNFFPEISNSTSKSKSQEPNRLTVTELSPRQQRKHSLLSQAQKFAELKKLDSNVLPFDLHLHINQDTAGFRTMSAVMPPSLDSGQSTISSPQGFTDSGSKRSNEFVESNLNVSDSVNSEGSNSTGDNCVDGVKTFLLTGSDSHANSSSKGGNSLICDTNIDVKSQSICDTKDGSFYDNLIEINSPKRNLSDTNESNSSGNIDKNESNSAVRVDFMNSNSGPTDEDRNAFDVYNIETALPDMDWNTLEEKLKAASEEAKQIQQARRNDREEIRKKLAMGGEDDCIDDDDDDDDEITYKKPNIQSRLHSGLQICFMNESPGDTDNEGLSPRQHEVHDNVQLMKNASSLVDSDNNLSCVSDLNNPIPPTTSIQSTSPPRLKGDEDNEKDFHSRQEELQNEAKLALAQAGSMAHMQLEIEKQLKKKSPMAEMVGIPGLGEKHRKKLSLRQLQQMNLTSIQVLYNDLQTQIESLNEELVHLLMERDELHMAQDSMLVDIEDLTRRAEELAERANRTGGNKGNKTNSVKGKLPAR